MSTPASSPRRSRADRERNRELIVTVAQELFAAADEARTPVSMNEIARRAGVGIATLYRHFGTREELAEAVYMSKLEEVTARSAHRTRDADARSALSDWSREFAAFMLAKRGMMDTLRAGWQSDAITDSPVMQRIAAIVADFLRRAEADRSLRPGLDPIDVAMGLLALLTTASTDAEGPRARRLMALFVDGLARHE